MQEQQASTMKRARRAGVAAETDTLVTTSLTLPPELLGRLDSLHAARRWKSRSQLGAALMDFGLERLQEFLEREAKLGRGQKRARAAR